MNVNVEHNDASGDVNFAIVAHHRHDTVAVRVHMVQLIECTASSTGHLQTF